jgi:hypothetical protein
MEMRCPEFLILIIGSYHATKARNRLQRPHLVKLTLSRKERGMAFKSEMEESEGSSVEIRGQLEFDLNANDVNYQSWLSCVVEKSLLRV